MGPRADPDMAAKRIILAFPRNLGRDFQALTSLQDA